MTGAPSSVMVERTARVARTGHGLAELEMDFNAACAGCTSLACGHAWRAQKDTDLRITVVDPIGTAPGDRVVVGIPESALMWGAVSAWLVPTLTFALGTILGQLATGSDGGAVLGALAGLGGGFLWARQRVASEGAHAYQPRLLRKTAPVAGSRELCREPAYNSPDNAQKY